MDVLLCWGSCSETASSGEHFQLVLIKQRLAAQVLRSISSEIFEPRLWLAASNSNHLTVGDVTPVSVEPAGCSHTTQLGKHSLQPGHQTSPLASVSRTMCSHTAVPHVHLCHALVLYPGDHYSCRKLPLRDTLHSQMAAGLLCK